MRRRHFLEAAATALAAAGQPIEGQEGRRNRLPHHALKLGTQHDSSDQALGVLAAFGVNHICSTLPSARMDATWSVEGRTRLRERVESFGIRLEMVPLPLSSSYITRSENPNIMLGKSPERDRVVETICQMIRNAARAGIPALKYNLTILGVVRSEPSRGRGGAHHSTFVYQKAAQDPPLTEAGLVSAEAAWERIAYFLKRVVPVAEEYKIRMACHPHDPDRGAGPAAHRSRAGQRGSRLGAHRVFLEAGRPGRRGIQNQDGLPPPRSRHAAR